MRKTVWSLAAAIGVIAIPAMAADGESLTLNPDQLPWARWQGRLSLGTAPSTSDVELISATRVRRGGPGPRLR